MQEIYNKNSDVLEDLLGIGEVDRGLEKKKRKAEDIDSLDMHEVRDAVNKRMGWVDSNHVELSGLGEDASELLDDIESREESDEFQHNKNRDAIDSADYDQLRELVDVYQKIIPRLVINEKILRPTAIQMFDMLDLQQLRHDESKVLEKIQEFESGRENRIKEHIDHVKKMMQANNQELTGAINELEAAVQGMNQSVARLLEGADVQLDTDRVARQVREQVVADVKEDIRDLVRQEMNDGSGSGSGSSGSSTDVGGDRGSSDGEDLAPGMPPVEDIHKKYNVSMNRAEIARLYFGDNDLNQQEIANKVGVAATQVSKFKKTQRFEEIKEDLG